ncbi:hypothetical protein BLNAU_18429 [Blattamonas nauphoetae]|uniref:Uncharacterized protein n=1 Tax=Blattamonas nauphoetae TaxID=2049346 RepID=A0ABQ9X6Y7_9EUKA|nr:hypothetical protein BLNAU_18429 [Blattamonas nauphoetae]
MKNPVTIQNCHFNTTDTSIEHAIFGVPLVSFSSIEHSFSIKWSSFNSFSASGYDLLAITTERSISLVSVQVSVCFSLHPPRKDRRYDRPNRHLKNIHRPLNRIGTFTKHHQSSSPSQRKCQSSSSSYKFLRLSNTPRFFIARLALSKSKTALCARMDQSLPSNSATPHSIDVFVIGHNLANTITPVKWEGNFFERTIPRFGDGFDFSLSFSSITIVVPPHSFQQSLFSSASEKLSFSSCSIFGTSTDPVTFSLIELKSGELVITSTEIKTVTLHSTLLKENWEGTLSSDSLRSSVLLSLSSVSSLSEEVSSFDTHSPLSEFYPRVAPRIVVTKDSKNEDLWLCGSAALPCLSMDVSVELTKVREVEVKGEEEIGSRLKMDGDCNDRRTQEARSGEDGWEGADCEQ